MRGEEQTHKGEELTQLRMQKQQILKAPEKKGDREWHLHAFVATLITWKYSILS